MAPIQVTVRYMTGEPACELEADDETTVHTLAAAVGDVVKQPVFAIRLMLPGSPGGGTATRVLSPHEVVKEVGVRSEGAAVEARLALELQLVVVGPLGEASKLLQELTKAMNRKFNLPTARIPDRHVEPIASKQVQEVLDATAAIVYGERGGTFPDDVSAWIEILERSPEGEHVSDHGLFRLRRSDLSTAVTAMHGGAIEHLLYLSMVMQNEITVFFVDITGELAKVFGREPAPSGVWVATVTEQAFRIPNMFSVAFWQEVQDSKHLDVASQPICVAPDLSSFFRLMLQQGDAPRRSYSTD